jgi:hypothetical protein
LLYFVNCLTSCIAYRDKKVVGVFVRFSCAAINLLEYGCGRDADL